MIAEREHAVEFARACSGGASDGRSADRPLRENAARRHSPRARRPLEICRARRPSHCPGAELQAGHRHRRRRNVAKLPRGWGSAWRHASNRARFGIPLPTGRSSDKIALLGDANLVGAGEPARLGPDRDWSTGVGGNLQPHEQRIVLLVDIIHEVRDLEPRRDRIAKRPDGEPVRKTAIFTSIGSPASPGFSQ